MPDSLNYLLVLHTQEPVRTHNRFEVTYQLSSSQALYVNMLNIK